jgi:hypothetical protein
VFFGAARRAKQAPVRAVGVAAQIHRNLAHAQHGRVERMRGDPLPAELIPPTVFVDLRKAFEHRSGFPHVGSARTRIVRSVEDASAIGRDSAERTVEHQAVANNPRAHDDRRSCDDKTEAADESTNSELADDEAVTDGNCSHER